MSTLESIKKQMNFLYQTNPNVHLNVNLTNPKLSLENTKAKIVGVYPHIFQIEECTTGEIKRHTLQYSDILINKIEVLELAKNG